MIPTKLVRERPFDDKPIFSEDQVWISHYRTRAACRHRARRGRRRRAVIHASVALGVVKALVRTPELAKYRTLPDRQKAGSGRSKSS
ncbi:MULTISPECIES: hypothetical protein [Sphingomonas]|uniref:hypothetical protein n=1 Tax=Sphingomonas TaxID=13687 RepID=UPI0020BF6FA2|nr:hypothetical protein [Sphingomonas faeni]MCK8455886.1 hypothetical protein [Sphingomonas faeni]